MGCSTGLLVFILFLSEIGFICYAIYQLFQGQYMASIASILIALVLKQNVTLPSNLFTELPDDDEYYEYDDYDDDDDEDDEPFVKSPPKHIQNLQTYKKDKKKTKKRCK